MVKLSKIELFSPIKCDVESTILAWSDYGLRNPVYRFVYQAVNNYSILLVRRDILYIHFGHKTISTSHVAGV